ncbi:flagellar assembly protein FliH [Undibacterium seohonense]|uniref:Flagellar assembly protein FliH n=1 Tax=Undibacterium seohonense TaxID=1344950 RepID=A0ABR6X919_9BURK|nr:flagellar assembly protein FliH [Undibacterium seohonense]MBC3809065.1 flagellar assembly protein FliH [Undibacterium seohonense]
MSNALSKGQQTAFQRWEMASFGDERPAQLERVAEAVKVSETEIAAIKEQARNEAYTTAYKEAYALGYQEGQDAGSAEMQIKIKDALAGIESIQHNFRQQLTQAHEDIGQDLLTLAVDLAGAMTKHQFEHHAEAIMEIVKESIEMLPAIHQPAQIFLHPDDLNLIREFMGSSLEQDGWRLFGDKHLTRGGCRIETAQNLIDATYETRWARLTETLSSMSSTSNHHL